MTENGTQEATRVAEELRWLFDTVAERAQPWLNQMREPAMPGDGPHPPSSCGWCPLCAAISLARGERPELAERLATHTLGLLGTLRAAMEPDEDRPSGAAPTGHSTADTGSSADARPAGAPSTGAPSADTDAGDTHATVTRSNDPHAMKSDDRRSAPTVQHITVERIPRP